MSPESFSNSRCYAVLYGQPCELVANHEGAHKAAGREWPRDLTKLEPEVEISNVRVADSNDMRESPLFGEWWVWRADGEPIHDEYLISGGGRDGTPDWDGVESEIESYLANMEPDDERSPVVYQAQRIRVDTGRVVIEHAELTVTPAEVES